MKYGIVLTAPTIAGQIEIAKQADRAGFESVWTTEFFNQHGLVRLTAIAMSTQRVKLGTAIAYAFMRTPMLAASGAMDIDELSGGRVILGLGTGTKTMNENWYSMPFDDPPAPRVSDAIGLIRAAFAAAEGGGLQHNGPYYQVNIPQFQRKGAARDSIPVCLAAVNQGMIRAAARVADGLVAHPVFTKHYISDTVLPILEGSSCKLLPYIITSIHEDEETARNEARGQIAFYYTTRLYHSILEGSGFESSAAKIASLFKQGEFMKMAAEVSDEMLDEIAIAGTPEQVKEKVQAWYPFSDHILLYSPSIGMGPKRVMENMQSIVTTFGNPQ